MASTYTKGTSIPYVPTDAANLYPETDGKTYGSKRLS